VGGAVRRSPRRSAVLRGRALACSQWHRRHERRFAGPPPEAPAAAAYHRNLVTRINQRFTEVVRTWEEKVVEYVGRRDEQTLLLAKQLDQLQRNGYDAEQMLDRAAARKPLPDDHATAALAYRIRERLKPTSRRRATPPEPHRSSPSSQAPGIGF